MLTKFCENDTHDLFHLIHKFHLFQQVEMDLIRQNVLKHWTKFAAWMKTDNTELWN